VNNLVFIVILAGGGGERLWPFSRQNRPKQCISLDGKLTLIQHTYNRALEIVENSKILVSTRNELQPLIKEQLPNAFVIAEPLARDSAAGMGYVCAHLLEQGINEPTIFMGADYFIPEITRFKEILETAVILANQDKISTIGIKPRRVETRFGYINPGKEVPDSKTSAYLVQSFAEKPTKTLAKEYIAHGYLWNSGMFVVKPSVLYENFRRYMPRLYEALQHIRETNFDPKVAYDQFTTLSKVSIDYGVMEKTSDLVVVKGDFEWDDIGTWDSLDRILESDNDGNVVQAPFLGVETQDCVIFGKKPIITLGISNLVIIEADDCVFVCTKKNARSIKKITARLETHPSLKKLLSFK